MDGIRHNFAHFGVLEAELVRPRAIDRTDLRCAALLYLAGDRVVRSGEVAL